MDASGIDFVLVRRAALKQLKYSAALSRGLAKQVLNFRFFLKGRRDGSQRGRATAPGVVKVACDD